MLILAERIQIRSKRGQENYISLNGHGQQSLDTSVILLNAVHFGHKRTFRDTYTGKKRNPCTILVLCKKSTINCQLLTGVLGFEFAT